MKKRYQIDQQRAVQQFRRLATEQNPNIQMILPMADIVGLLQEGVGNLLRHAGLELMHLVMDEEVKSLAGERHQQHEQRRAHRWGKEDGYCVVDGQKVPIKRTRLRSGDNREQRLGSYELFQRSGPLQQGVWDKMMRGLSTRNYGAVVKDFQSAYGIEKSAVSENFIEASREKVKQLMERPLGELRLCAVLIDGTPFKDRQMIAALWLGCLHPTLPGPQETQCRGSLAGRTQSRRQKETPERLRDGRLRRCQAGIGPSASRVNGSESQRGAQPGRRDGRNAHRSQVARAGS